MYRTAVDAAVRSLVDGYTTTITCIRTDGCSASAKLRTDRRRRDPISVAASKRINAGSVVQNLCPPCTPRATFANAPTFVAAPITDVRPTTGCECPDAKLGRRWLPCQPHNNDDDDERR